MSEKLQRGADNVVQHVLRVTEGEEVALFEWEAARFRDVFRDAVRRAGGVPVPIDTSDLAEASEAQATAAITRRAGDATASILCAAHGIPPALSMAVLALASQRRLRHLHLTRIDARLFSQSYRADPERIARLNARVVEAIEAAGSLQATSDAGTDVRIGTSARYPLLSSDGRPGPGEPDNLPSGSVLFHPATVDGVFVADRGALGAIRPDPTELRRHPLRVYLERGRAVRFESGSDAIAELARGYATQHPDATRVGIVAFPTNYVIRSETRLEVQDALLPGLNIILGFSHHRATRAPYQCPIQLRLFGRRLDVRAGDAPLVERGRHADSLASEIDLFR